MNRVKPDGSTGKPNEVHELGLSKNSLIAVMVALATLLATFAGLVQQGGFLRPTLITLSICVLGQILVLSFYERAAKRSAERKAAPLFAGATYKHQTFYVDLNERRELYLASHHFIICPMKIESASDVEIVIDGPYLLPYGPSVKRIKDSKNLFSVMSSSRLIAIEAGGGEFFGVLISIVDVDPALKRVMIGVDFGYIPRRAD